MSIVVPSLDFCYLSLEATRFCLHKYIKLL